MNYKIFSEKVALFFVVIFSSFFLVISSAFADVNGKIDECSGALGSFMGENTPRTITQGGSLKNITEFPCIQHNAEMRAFQIVMDEKFKAIDEEMETFLNNLYTSKDFYFGEGESGGEKFTADDALEHIEELASQFYTQFDTACSESVGETAEVFGGSLTVGSTNEFIAGSDLGACRMLARKKIRIFKQIAYNGLALNSSYLERDAKKKYNKQQRTKYDEVLDLMMLHLSYVERLWKKTSSLHKNVY